MATTAQRDLYHPLRPRGLLAQLAVVVAAEVLLFTSYSSHQAAFHWATHLLRVGAVAVGRVRHL